MKIIYEKPRKRYKTWKFRKRRKRLRENGRKEREELEERSRNWNCKKEMVQRHMQNPTRGTKKGERRNKWT